MTNASPKLAFAAAADYQQARDVLRRAGFTSAGLAEAFGGERLLAPADDRLPELLHRTAGGSPRDTFIRLFFLEQEVEEAPVREALDDARLDDWIDAGLLTRRDGNISAPIRLLPYDDLYLASDPLSEIRRGARADFVMSLGHATELLAFAALEGRGGDLLDLGAGCGALGLLGAAASGRVLATDINPRAIAFTRFNALLNGVANLEATAGDLFAPASGRQFDRIVCNPPFVIAPGARFIFRDSGRRGDEFCRELARAAPPLLAEGGTFQMLANCPHLAGGDWRDDWRTWFEGLGCDCIVWANQTDDVGRYAATWIGDTEAGDLRQQREHYDQWMRYYEAEGIQAITYGVVTLRRRGSGGENFTLIDDAERKITARCGAQLEQAFRLEDHLAGLVTESQRLDARYRLSPQAALVETSTADASGKLALRAAAVRLVEGAELESELDPAARELIRGCDGQTSLRELVPRLAAQFELPADTLAGALPLVAIQLARRGYLLPG